MDTSTRRTGPAGNPGTDAGATALFSAAILVGSALLFWVELMFAKMVLPVLGGSPAVWNTCLFFFQGMLLAGYAYAHASLRRLSPKRQAALHLAVVLAAALALPIALPRGWAPPPTSHPVLPLLLAMLLAIGPPVFAVSATAPILQRWYSRMRGGAVDPYFLYAASNAGAIGALLLFPFLIEPRLPLTAQSRLWTAAYLVWAGGLMTGCAAYLRRPAIDGAARSPDPLPRPAARRHGPARWLLLSFVPASLLYGATAHITSEIAPVPLLWVVPLSLYLLSFVLTFARRPWPPHAFTAAVFPFLAVLLVPAFFRPAAGVLFILPHLVLLSVASLACHGELASSRPPAAELSGYYVWLALGGLLGGAFNLLVAPLAFTAAPLEYPLAMALAFGMAGTEKEGVEAAAPRGRFPGGFLLPAAAVAAVFVLAENSRASWIGRLPFHVVVLTLGFVACLAFRRSGARFGAAVGAVMLAAYFVGQRNVDFLHRERNFFGTLAVLAEHGTTHVLTRGTTSHGAQDFRPENRRRPLVYFSPEGPLGDYFRAFADALAGKRIAVAGLGVGSVAAYGRRGQEITFYEIDPAVERVARDGRFFTFLADSPAAVRVVIGDARLRLAEAPDRSYALIVLDAFTSDAVPTHLLTREALSLYLRKLEPGGAVLVNFSNRYLALEPLLAGIARDAGAVCFVRYDGEALSRGGVPLKAVSSWAAIARRPEDLGWLPAYRGWAPAGGARTVLWTDDSSSIAGVLQPLRW